MRDIDRWIDKQERHQQSVVRLEEALLGGHLARYFAYRLRFFVARTAISTLIHAAKILLLLGAFPRDLFITIIILEAVLAMTTDFWWGALEQMRTRIRELQKRAAGYIVPREIASWLTLSVIVAVAVLVGATGFAVYSLIGGGIGPGAALVIALLIGASLEFVTRTYHSGAYAIRRVYRPLPSLLVLDVVSVGMLLAFYPLIGIWAFPLAELVTALSVAAVTFHYVSRTYQTLALPTIMPMLRERRRIPSAWQLRAALLPGVSYALVGLEALIVIAGSATISTGAGESLVILLAVLAPVNRAGFEWARLLYYDLKKMDVPVLRSLRERFDRASRRVALVMGGITWAIAAVGVVIVGGLSGLLLLALLVMFVARALLATTQIQAFSSDQFLRLTIVGVAGVVGLLAAFTFVQSQELQILAIGAVLAISFMVLLETARDDDGDDTLLSLPDWLRRLRDAPGSVVVAQLSFDTRLDARGTTGEMRRAERSRRDTAAERIAKRVGREQGAAAWLSSTQLWLFALGDEASAAAWQSHSLGLAGGLVDRAPIRSVHASGSEAARAMADLATHASDSTQTPAALIADFVRRFPRGICYDLSTAPPVALKHIPADQRGEIYREAIEFASDLEAGSELDDLEVTSLCVDGVMRAVFVVDRGIDGRLRKAWRTTLRNWMLQASASVREELSGESAVAIASAGEARML